LYDIYKEFSCLVLCHSDSAVNNDRHRDKDDDRGDNDGADEDTTLVKQSVSTAAAAGATGTEQHIESLIADLQQYASLLDISELQSQKCWFL